MSDDRIKYNRRYFEKLTAKLSHVSCIDKKLALAQTAINFASTFSTGYFSSKKIEEELLHIAQNLRAQNLSSTYAPKSFLHVFTKTYATGGHTRVAERWIEYAAQGQVHSVAVTGGGKEAIPARLQRAVSEKHGRIIVLDNSKGSLAKALELRELSSNFEYIVLHVHPNDFVPVLAFGTAEFTRPVIFFNHADHKFSVGVSIADLFAELREFGQEFSATRRKPKSQFILDVPLDSMRLEAISKVEARSRLKLPEDCKIIMTVGSAFKYQAFREYDFIAVAEELISRIPDSIVIAIGPDAKKQPEWYQAGVRSNSRIFAKGPVPHTDLFTYLLASDLILDSFPMSGGVAMLDAACCGVPMLSLHTPIGQYNYITKTDYYCRSIQELIEKVIAIMSDPQEAAKNVNAVQDELSARNYRESWLINLNQMVGIVPDRHCINSFTDADWSIDEVDRFLDNACNLSAKTNLKLSSIFEIKTAKKQDDRFLMVKMLNKYYIARFKKMKF